MSDEPRQPAPPTQRRHHAIALGLALLALTLGLALDEPEQWSWGDSAEFVVLAKSLASGQGYREINQPARPVHKKFPVGFPLMLAAVERVRPDGVQAMKLVVLAQFALSTVLVYWLVLLWSGAGLAAVVALLFCCNGLALTFAGQLMSEVPFLLASLLALLFNEQDERRGSRWLHGGTLLACAWALLLRTVGVALCAALCLRLALKRRFGRLAALAVTTAGVLVVQALVRGGGAGDYVTSLLSADPYDASKGPLGLHGLYVRALSNLARYGLELLPSSILPAYGQRTLLLAVTLLVAAGLLRSLLRGHVGALVFLFTLATLLVWPSIWAVHRFVMPLLPLTLFLALLPLWWPLAWLGRRSSTVGRWVAPGAAALLIGMAGYLNLAQVVRAHGGQKPRWEQYVRGMEWLRENTPPEAVVMCRKPFEGYLLSKRRTLAVPRSPEREAFFRELDANGVDYLVVDSLGLPGTREILARNINASRDRFALVHRAVRPPLWIFRYPAEPTGAAAALRSSSGTPPR